MWICDVCLCDWCGLLIDVDKSLMPAYSLTWMCDQCLLVVDVDVWPVPACDWCGCGQWLWLMLICGQCMLVPAFDDWCGSATIVCDWYECVTSACLWLMWIWDQCLYVIDVDLGPLFVIDVHVWPVTARDRCGWVTGVGSVRHLTHPLCKWIIFYLSTTESAILWQISALEISLGLTWPSGRYSI